VSNISRWIFERNGNAVSSLLFAVAGLFGFGVILGPIAIGLGLLGRSQIAERYRPGIRLAYAGIVIGIIALVAPIVLYVR
jgi:hypothetical protein